MRKYKFFRGREPRFFEKCFGFLDVRNLDLVDDVLMCASSYIVRENLAHADYVLPILYKIFKDKNTIPRDYFLITHNHSLNVYQTRLNNFVHRLCGLIISTWQNLYSIRDSETHHTNLDYEAELCSTIAEHLNWVETI